MSDRQSYYVGIKGIIKDETGRVLILKDSSTGKWEVPGGRIDADQTIEESFSLELASKHHEDELVRQSAKDMIHSHEQAVFNGAMGNPPADA